MEAPRLMARAYTDLRRKGQPKSSSNGGCGWHGQGGGSRELAADGLCALNTCNFRGLSPRVWYKCPHENKGVRMANRLQDLFERVAALRVEQHLRDGRTLEEDENLPVETRLQHAIEDAAASGELLHAGVRWATVGVSVTGALVGFGSLMGVTAGRGDTPINVLWLIGLAMILPGLSAVLSGLAAWVLRRRYRQDIRGGLVDALIRVWIARGIQLAAKTLNPRDPRHQRRIEGAKGAVRGSYRLVKPVMPWLVLRVSQYFGIWLTIGFASALLLRLATMDLTFGWYTTMGAVAENMPKIIQWLSAPFGWLHADLRVSETLVRASQYSRYLQGFVDDGYAVRHTGDWWPFLFVGVTFWGGLPRVVLLAWAHWNTRRAIEKVLQETAPMHAIRQRIKGWSSGASIFDGSGPELGDDPVEALREAAAQGREHGAGQAVHPRGAETHDVPATAAFLYWEQDVFVADGLRKRIASVLGVRPALEELWGNDADADADLLRSVQSLAPDCVCVFVEPFANPGAGFRRQIAALRSVLTPHTPIVFHLGWYAPDGTQRPHSERQQEVWQQSIDALADPAMDVLEISSAAHVVS